MGENNNRQRNKAINFIIEYLCIPVVLVTNFAPTASRVTTYLTTPAHLLNNTSSTTHKHYNINTFPSSLDISSLTQHCSPIHLAFIPCLFLNFSDHLPIHILKLLSFLKNEVPQKKKNKVQTHQTSNANQQPTQTTTRNTLYFSCANICLQAHNCKLQ